MRQAEKDSQQNCRDTRREHAATATQTDETWHFKAGREETTGISLLDPNPG